MKKPDISPLIIFTVFLLSAFVPRMTYGQVKYVAEKDRFYLSGIIKSTVTKEFVRDAITVTLDKEGNPSDTLKSTMVVPSSDGDKVFSHVTLYVPRRDSVYVFDVSAPGYETKRVRWEVTKIGKRETQREMPVIFLERAAKKLDEVTVTASKIKFYNKGDTLVFNADAFQLAEGSMLDALISQLPGVELKDDGQIFFNGKFVESLLLNGRQFLGGDNQLMLENIASYTVKTVEVYEGQTDYEKWENDTTRQKHLTMDVRMKKEYMRGWLVNAQGGYGTKDRYMGRLFASLFTPTTNLTLLGNVNNLDDNRKPGRSDSWMPSMSPSGTKTYQMGALNYDYKKGDNTQSNSGYVTVEHTSLNTRVMTERENFLSGGNTFENRFSNSSNNDVKIETSHNGSWFKPRFYLGGRLVARYSKKSQGNDDISATFNKEQTEMTSKALHALYNDGSPELLETVINRNISRTDGSSHDGEFQIFPSYAWKVPGTSDQLKVEVGFKYRDRKEERWKDFEINYGKNPVPAEKRRQYFDNSPNRSLTTYGDVNYSLRLPGGVNFKLDYEYRFINDDKDSHMYALDRLADMGIFGTIPAGYLDVEDPDNSYTSRLITNRHTLSPAISGILGARKSYMLFFNMSVELGLVNRHFDYWRAGRQYLVSKRDFTSAIKTGSTMIQLNFSPQTDATGVKSYRNTMTYLISSDVKLPDLAHTIDIENTADPLNITLGNPDLKQATVWHHALNWNTRLNLPLKLNNGLNMSYDYAINDIVRGYTYDTSTGVRVMRSYNVDGARTFRASEHASCYFGPGGMFTSSLTLDYSLNRYSDMIGVNKREPEKSIVSSNMFSQSLMVGMTLKKLKLSVQGRHTGRKTSSTREDFHVIDADNFQYGLNGNIKLPYGFGLSTDFTVYSRRGYGSKELDRDDAIWNVRATWATKNNRWVFTTDAFDMLHQLSNVNYGISASGRTVTWTNALPRYILFTVQYRLSIQPKKRR